MIIFCKLHQDLSSHFVNRCPTAASTTYSSTPPNLSNEINNNHNIIMIWKKKMVSRRFEFILKILYMVIKIYGI